MVQEFLHNYFAELLSLLYDMSPWLLLGFLIAGVLHVFFPEGKINRLLGKGNVQSVIKAALFGIPLPLCSCGVIPTGVSIHKSGASKGASVSFLISTPQTGVDSIMVTYSLLGLPFAIIRPIVALFTGVLGGALTNKFEPTIQHVQPMHTSGDERNVRPKQWFLEIFRYAFVDFLSDIAKWLIIGLLLAGLIAVFVPDDFFASYIKNDWLGMLIILVASIPVYVCATSSVPIAAVLLMKGLSPGAVLVFLMAGPATNAATISVIGNAMGRKTLISYLVSIIAGALVFGAIIDQFLPREWFTLAIDHSMHGHEHGLLPQWIMVASGWVMLMAIANVYRRKWFNRNKLKTTAKQIVPDMKEIKVIVRGMNCNHCKANVERALGQVEGIDSTLADVEQEMVTLTGDNIDLDEVKKSVESVGYKYEGVKE